MTGWRRRLAHWWAFNVVGGRWRIVMPTPGEVYRTLVRGGHRREAYPLKAGKR